MVENQTLTTFLKVLFGNVVGNALYLKQQKRSNYEQSNRRIAPMGSTCPKCGESKGNE